MRVLFFSHIKDKQLLKDISFYEQDIRALQEMGYDVVISNKLRDFFIKKYDCVYIWWWTWAIVPILWSYIRKFKIVIAGAFHYRTPFTKSSDFIRRSYLYQAVVKFCLKHADGNIFVSRYEFNEVVNNLHVKNPKLVLHGIDVNKFHPATHQLLNQSWPRSNLIIFSIAWLEVNNLERKCIYESLLAFNLVCQKLSNVKYYIAGRDGSGSKDLREFIRTLSCRDNVFLLGHITENEKIKMLQSSDIFLSPTYYEGFGLAIAEALACGCPVVTSDNGAVREVAGDSALFANPSSPREIADQILLLLSSKSLSREMKIKSAERIASNFSYNNHYEQLRVAIKSIFN